MTYGGSGATEDTHSHDTAKEPSALLVVHVSPMPYGAHKVSPVGRYLIDLAEHITRQDPNIKQVVLCQRDSVQSVVAGDLETLPAFWFGTFALFEIDRVLPRTRGAVVHVQYETALFGSVAASLFIPWFIARWRKRGYRVVLTMHHVIAPDFGVRQLRLWKPQSKLDPLAPTVLRFLQWALARSADAVIVHEHSHQQILTERLSTRIPLMLRSAEREQRPNEGRLRLTFFGFLANYKGTLELVRAINELADEGFDCELAIIGTLHPRLRHSAPYKDYLSDLVELVDANPYVNLRGFLPEEMVDEELGNADLLMLPYKASISASAALARAWSIGCAVAVSRVLHEEYRLPSEVPSFDPTVDGIKAFLRGFDRSRCEPARRFAAIERAERDGPHVARRTIAVYRQLTDDSRPTVSVDP